MLIGNVDWDNSMHHHLLDNTMNWFNNILGIEAKSSKNLFDEIENYHTKKHAAIQDVKVMHVAIHHLVLMLLIPYSYNLENVIDRCVYKANQHYCLANTVTVMPSPWMLLPTELWL
jgi:hypothetical protein